MFAKCSEHIRLQIVPRKKIDKKYVFLWIFKKDLCKKNIFFKNSQKSSKCVSNVLFTFLFFVETLICDAFFSKLKILVCYLRLIFPRIQFLNWRNWLIDLMDRTEIPHIAYAASSFSASCNKVISWLFWSKFSFLLLSPTE